jgi:hypothetical protein
MFLSLVSLFLVFSPGLLSFRTNNAIGSSRSPLLAIALSSLREGHLVSLLPLNRRRSALISSLAIRDIPGAISAGREAISAKTAQTTLPHLRMMPQRNRLLSVLLGVITTSPLEKASLVRHMLLPVLFIQTMHLTILVLLAKHTVSTLPRTIRHLLQKIIFGLLIPVPPNT